MTKNRKKQCFEKLLSDYYDTRCKKAFCSNIFCGTRNRPNIKIVTENNELLIGMGPVLLSDLITEAEYRFVERAEQIKLEMIDLLFAETED